MLEDLNHALKTLVRNRGLYSLVAGILALGIAATVTTLTLADAVLLRPIPFPEGDRLVTIYEQNLGAGVTQMLLSHPTFEDLAEADSLELIAAYQATNALTLAGDPEAIRVQSNFVSRDYFTLVGARAAVGTLFNEDAHRGPMAQSVAVLSWGLWQSRFGGDRGLIGRSVDLNGHPFEVVGVLPQGFDDLPAAGTPTDVWLPLETYGVLGYDWELLERRTTRFLATVARLAPGFDLAQARAEMQGVGERLATAYPESHGGYSLVTRTIGDFSTETARPAILALVGGAFFVLLLGCTNAANLLLVRATGRRGEMALHLALGASRRRLSRRLTLEGLITSLVAAALGFALGMVAVRSLLALSPIVLPDYVDLRPSGAVLAVTLLLSVATGWVFGLVPGIAARFHCLSDTLRSEGRGSSSASDRWRRSLMVVEIASAVALLLGGLLMTESFRNLSRTSPGFATQRLLTLKTSLPAARYDSDDRLRAFARGVRQDLAGQPGVEEPVVWAPGMPSQALWYRSFAAVDRPITSMNEAVAGRFHTISAGALRALEIPLVAGRGIEETDRADTTPVVVVSASAAQAFFGHADPIGRRIHRFRSRESVAEETHYTIVGVVADARHGGRAIEELSPVDVYYAFEQMPQREISFLVRTRVPLLGLTEIVRQSVRAIDPELPLYDFQSMQQRLSVETEQSRFAAFLSASFAVVSALLAGLGLYCVLAFFAQTRTREIGIRMALGGRRLDIVQWMSRQVAVILVAGLALGLAAAQGLGRLLENSLFGVRVWDPVIVLTVLAATALVSALASLLPLLRASRVTPAVALRSD